MCKVPSFPSCPLKSKHVMSAACLGKGFIIFACLSCMPAAYHIVLPMQPVSALHCMVLCAPVMLSVLLRWKVPHILVLDSCEAMCAPQQTVEHLCLHCSWRSRKDELHRQGHHQLPDQCRVSSLFQSCRLHVSQLLS